jgi:membrane peptidoglycan carboxypeptidase
MGYPQAEIPMISVHGISVTGGSFPAQIWHQYMESALANVRPFDFLLPRHPPVYKVFVRGDSAIAGGYYPTTSSTSSTTTSTATTAPETTTEVATTAPATTTVEQPPPVITDTAPVVTDTQPPPGTTTYTDTIATG